MASVHLNAGAIKVLPYNLNSGRRNEAAPSRHAYSLRWFILHLPAHLHAALPPFAGRSPRGLHALDIASGNGHMTGDIMVRTREHRRARHWHAFIPARALLSRVARQNSICLPTHQTPYGARSSCARCARGGMCAAGWAQRGLLFIVFLGGSRHGGARPPIAQYRCAGTAWRLAAGGTFYILRLISPPAWHAGARAAVRHTLPLLAPICKTPRWKRHAARTCTATRTLRP